MDTFKELGVKPQFLKGIKELGIEIPTEIQKKSIPFLLNKGSDFIGQAQTGTGKTAAFGLPLLHRVDAKKTYPQALILAPTRELGQQIAKQLFRFTKYSEKIFTEAVYGGEKIERQISALTRPTHILVATPGRLIELANKKVVNLEQIKTVVLDEADEMLSMGFKKELDTILEKTINKQSTWLFSATMPPGIKQIIKNYMAHDTHKIEVKKDDVMNKSIKHQYLSCEKNQKLYALIRFLQDGGNDRGIVFCRTKASAQTLVKQLKSKNIFTDSIHGDLKQIERDKVMRAFKNEKLQVLVATDISARGIDIDNLAFVVHYQLPDQTEYFTHRSGRTARAGKKGLSLCLIEPSDKVKLSKLEKELSIKFEKRAD